MCQCALDAQLTCFSKDGAIYCKEDYYSRFCVQCCARCGLGIPASSLVMRARDSVFHLRCFTCLPCGAALRPGDLFTMRGGDLYCQRHSTHGHTPKPRLRKRRATPTERERNTAGLLPLEEGEGFLGGPEPQLAGQQQEGMSVSKTKRIRTCFKNHQLRTMESYFAVKHNPDGKDWEQLAKRTGLPKRVLQEGEGFLGGPEPQLAGQQQEGMSVSKTKRIRTCFKNHQLRTMESYFAVKHNPDGKDWEQLAKRTGLPKRVLQVGMGQGLQRGQGCPRECCRAGQGYREDRAALESAAGWDRASERTGLPKRVLQGGAGQGYREDRAALESAAGRDRATERTGLP
ncbi:UNVERIFIED_CONTAM: hypothetical protein FKN15_014483 [Acipenser sinensis]